MHIYEQVALAILLTLWIPYAVFGIIGVILTITDTITRQGGTNDAEVQ